jgi:outer membrane protein assembly factor BamB
VLALALISLASPANWTQFRLHDDNNAVVPGTLAVSWRLTTAAGFSSSPSLTGTTLFIGNNAGELLAVDVRSGTVRWKATVQNPLMSAPIVYGDLVIVGEGNENSPQGSSPSHPIRVGDPPSALLAFRRDTGNLVWRTPLTGSGMPTPAIISGTLYHHDGSGMLLAVNPANGAVRYRRALRSIASMSAIVPIGTAFVTQGVDPNAVYAIDAASGAVRWRALFSSVASGLGDCPSAADTRQIYCDYVMPPSAATPVQTERQAQSRAFALDIRTGKRLWDVLLQRGTLPKRNEAAIPLVMPQSVIMGSSISSSVYALDPSTGRILWSVKTHGPVKGGIVKAGGALYFGDLGGYLWAVNASSGHTIGARNTRTPFNVGSPILAGQTLIIGSRGGTLLALPLALIRNSHDR